MSIRHLALRVGLGSGPKFYELEAEENCAARLGSILDSDADRFATVSELLDPVSSLNFVNFNSI